MTSGDPRRLVDWRRMAGRVWKAAVGGFVGSVLFGTVALAANTHEADDGGRVERLERTVEQLNEKVRALEEQLGRSEGATSERRDRAPDVPMRSEPSSGELMDQETAWFKKFSFGGYGELHANFGEGSDPDQIDFHRLVAYVGYDFADWIKFNSEIELEHAFVADSDSGEVGGEFVVEQAFFDLLLSEPLNVRIGRVLTPLGIVNEAHEPTLFYGVERPSFAWYIVPTTWSSDGIGIFGNLNRSTSYQAYIVGGLDGSGFSATSGIRGGRIKERPSLHEPAVTGRLDYVPFPDAEGHDLRLGVSGYFGGLDNGNKGDNPDIDGDIQIYSADFQYSVSPFEFRGVVADIRIDEAGDIGSGTAEEIFGWYLEAACHVLPDGWKKNKLTHSDAVVFVRYDDFDTQYKMPSGVAADPAGDRSEWTAGLSFYLNPNVVLKADYQIRDDSGEDLGDRINLGLGWAY